MIKLSTRLRLAIRNLWLRNRTPIEREIWLLERAVERGWEQIEHYAMDDDWEHQEMLERHRQELRIQWLTRLKAKLVRDRPRRVVKKL